MVKEARKCPAWTIISAEQFPLNQVRLYLCVNKGLPPLTLPPSAIISDGFILCVRERGSRSFPTGWLRNFSCASSSFVLEPVGIIVLKHGPLNVCLDYRRRKFAHPQAPGAATHLQRYWHDRRGSSGKFWIPPGRLEDRGTPPWRHCIRR
jgi:hypothetical protein